MKSRIVVASLVALLLLLAPVAAHASADPPEYRTRLLHDCNDDYFGGDASGDGWDIHSLDAQPMTAGGVEGTLFALTLNGRGNAEITVEFGSQTAKFLRSGNAWTGEGFTRVATRATGDGERIELVGFLPNTQASVTEYRVVGEYPSGTDVVSGDREGNDNPSPLAVCSDTFYRQSYRPVGGDVHLTGGSGDQVAPLSTTLEAQPDSYSWYRIPVLNPYGVAQVLQISGQVVGGDPVELRYHKGDQYTPLPTSRELRADGGDELHLAVRAPAGTESQIRMTLTTTIGYEQTWDLTFRTAPDAPEPVDGSSITPGASTPNEEAPGLGLVAIVAFLAIVASKRRS